MYDLETGGNWINCSSNCFGLLDYNVGWNIWDWQPQEVKNQKRSCLVLSRTFLFLKEPKLTTCLSPSSETYAFVLHFLVLHLLNSSINVLKWSFLNTCVPTFISWQAQSPCRVVSLAVATSQSPKSLHCTLLQNQWQQGKPPQSAPQSSEQWQKSKEAQTGGVSLPEPKSESESATKNSN